ncbi:MAG TPA: iron-sulfur cluster assembly scaffold protein [Syntrophales bacterium]|nr:iron-sulfur cluster assembly scaffold protein [Syntrophales bacterium]HPX55344.1 iron-sulfur cluster assembly scaffold protein [Syntrophales bacterium]HQA81751.1 iron-sulfur cluster assembly scaffold protein [Syntrophales bacterium]
MLDSLEAAIEKVKACLKEKEGIDYSDQVIRNWIGPSHRGEISKPQGYAEVSRSCGDGMAFYLRINEDRIVEARFTSEGCIGTIASGNMTAVLAEGNTVYDAFDIEEQAVMDALGGLPKGEEHCAELACAALRQALRYYLTYRNDPWKRSYPEPR